LPLSLSEVESYLSLVDSSFASCRQAYPSPQLMVHTSSRSSNSFIPLNPPFLSEEIPFPAAFSSNSDSYSFPSLYVLLVDPSFSPLDFLYEDFHDRRRFWVDDFRPCLAGPFFDSRCSSFMPFSPFFGGRCFPMCNHWLSGPPKGLSDISPLGSRCGCGSWQISAFSLVSISCLARPDLVCLYPPLSAHSFPRLP